MIDRRGGSDRRNHPRHAVSIEIEWEGAEGRKTGTVSDISFDGCFVLCAGEVENGDRIRIFLPFSGGMKAEFNGEVVNHFYEIGFALKFSDLGSAQVNLLQKVLATRDES